MLTFIVLILVALVAAAAHTGISDRSAPDRGVRFAARWLAYAMLLTLPALLPRLLGA